MTASGYRMLWQTIVYPLQARCLPASHVHQDHPRPSSLHGLPLVSRTLPSWNHKQLNSSGQKLTPPRVMVKGERDPLITVSPIGGSRQANINPLPGMTCSGDSMSTRFSMNSWSPSSAEVRRSTAWLLGMIFMLCYLYAAVDT